MDSGSQQVRDRSQAGPWSLRGVPPAALAALAALTLLALALRLLSLDQSLWGDEGFTWIVTGRDSVGGVVDAVRSSYEVTPPLYFVFAWLFRRLGDTPEMIRAPSVLAGTALVPVVFVLGSRTLGWRVGLLASALLALSPIAIYYSVEARNYSLLALILALSTLVLLRATTKGASRWWWLAFSLLTALAVYTHYTSVFVISGQFLWVLLFRRSHALWLLASGLLVAALFVPWLPELERDTGALGSVAIDRLYPLTARSYVRGCVAWIIGLPEASLLVVPGIEGLVLLAFSVAIAALSHLRSLRERSAGWAPNTADRTWLLVFLAAAAPLGTLAVSLVSNDIFLPRNLLSSLPAALIVLAGAAMSVRGTLRWGAVASLVLAFGVAAAFTFRAEAQRPNYRGVARLIDQEAAPHTVVVIYSALVGADWNQYTAFQARKPHTFLTLNLTNFYTSAVSPVAFDKQGGLGRPLKVFPAGETLEGAAGALSRSRQNREIFLVVPETPVFAAPRRIPGYERVGAQRVAGSIPLVVERYLRTASQMGR